MISAVVLAAGASTRMGAPKLLLPLGDEPIIRRTVRQVCECGADDVLVVSGHEHDRLVAALAGLPVRHARNADFATGMGSSFRTGVEHLPDGSDAALFALADQPFLTPDHYRSLLDAYRRQRPVIVGSRFGDVTAPPHLFNRALYPELAALTHGARGILERHAAAMLVLQFDASLLMDIDTPDDYQRARLRVAAGR